MVQTAFPATALLTRLQTVFTDQPVAGVMAAPAHPTASHFRDGMDEVFTLMVHETDGWPTRNKVETWVNGYTHASPPAGTGNGLGPQTAIAADGTVTQIMQYPHVTWHGEFLNGRSLGTETGHGGDARDEGGTPASPPPDIAPDTTPGGVIREGWRALSAEAEDIPGAKLFCRDHRAGNPNEVLICWWTSSLYTTRTHADFLIPARSPPGGPQNYPAHIKAVPPNPSVMVFSEAQYRSWSLLARFLCETFLIPRNLPLFPWTNRADNLRSPAAGGSPMFRLIVKSDPNFTTIRDDLSAHVAGFNNTIFDDANLATFRTSYDNANVGAGTINEAIFNLVGNNKALNKAWLYLFKSFRGVIGHGFAGSAVHGDHDCPGPMFDWYRFARELYDWWWYPFDFDAAFTTTATLKRAILTPRSESVGGTDPGSETPLIEHFWENTPADTTRHPYEDRILRPPGALLGQTASPDTFRLEAGAPIYAMANGELVAARIIRPGAGVNMSFVLVRHEIFHKLDRSGFQPLIALLGGAPAPAPAHVASPYRIDYVAEPSVAYSLYMHLGGGDQVNFDEPAAANPTWLNRVLVRKKECDLAIGAGGAVNAALQAMTPASFTHPPPPAANRPTPLELFTMDKERLGTFMDHLRAGNVAPAPIRSVFDNFGPTPIKVLLSDFLGVAGITRVGAPTPSLGVLVEVFSPSLIDSTAFNEVPGKTAWEPGTVSHPVIRYVSEWGRSLTQQEIIAAIGAGVTFAQIQWWQQAISNELLLALQAADHALPMDGLVYHYAPLDFIRWLNGVTWISEWPKYKAKDGGVDVPTPARPPARRI